MRDERPVLPRFALVVEGAPSGIPGEEASEAPRTHAISRRSTLVGSAAWAHIRIEDAFVSGQHARLLLRDSDLHLDDVGSTNSTQVNGLSVTTRVEIRPGDVVQFADVRCRVESPAGLPETPAPPAEPVEAVPQEDAWRSEALKLPAVHVAGPLPGEPLRFRLKAAAALVAVAILAFWLFR